MIALNWNVAVHSATGAPVTVEPLSVELKKAGAFDEVLRRKIAWAYGIRTTAAHGGDFKATERDVEDMIRAVIDVCDRVKST